MLRSSISAGNLLLWCLFSLFLHFFSFSSKWFMMCHLDTTVRSLENLRKPWRPCWQKPWANSHTYPRYDIIGRVDHPIRFVLYYWKETVQAIKLLKVCFFMAGGGLGWEFITAAGPVHIHYWFAKSWRGILRSRLDFALIFYDMLTNGTFWWPGARWAGWRSLLKTHCSRWLWRTISLL